MPEAVSASKASQILERCRREPGWFAREVLGVHWWSMQVAIAESVRDHERTAVKAANGVGKTFNAAGIVLWFLLCFPRSRVVTTATTWPQVEKLLWHELGLQHRNARFPLGGQLNLTELKLPDGRYAIGLSTKPTELESFQGHHAPNLLLVYDEASGIPAPIFEAGEGYMTAAGARMLLIGNPTKPSGEMYEAFNSASKRGDYERFTIGWRDTPAFTGEECPQEVLDALPTPAKYVSRKRMWGEDSPLFQVRVLGRYARTSTNTVIQLGDLEDAQARRFEPDLQVEADIVVACDVARFGDDETVIACRLGQHVEILETYIGQRPPGITTDKGTVGDTVHTAGRIIEHASRYPRHVVRLVIDDAGVGGGVTDILRNAGWNVTAYNAGAKAHDPLAFPNRRSEMWFKLAALLPELDLPADDQLAADLLAPTYGYEHGSMRRVVEKKDKTKKRLGRSPDRADAVMLTIVPSGVPTSPQVVEVERGVDLADSDAPGIYGDLYDDPM